MRGAARVLSFAAVAIAIACASCFIVTGSTDGYAPIPVDARAGGDTDASGLTLDCLSATDCVDGGPQICCLVLTSTSSAATTCQTGACSGAFAAQICAADAECGDAACLSQHCAFGGSSFTLHACGTLPTCTAR